MKTIYRATLAVYNPQGILIRNHAVKKIEVEHREGDDPFEATFKEAEKYFEGVDKPPLKKNWTYAVNMRMMK